MSEPRTILHVDMDAFFASVEQRDHPELRGKPVLVGHDGPRGVVAAASYEARKFGCRSAMPMAVAKRLCPQARIVSGSYGRYGEVSSLVFAIFERFTPQLEPLSCDEAFLDVTGVQRLHGSGETIGWAIKKAVFTETQLTCSVGVAHCKFLAKLASDMHKPDGLVLFDQDKIDHLLPTLPVSRIYGIGTKTAERLNSVGIATIGDLRQLPLDFLTAQLGSSAEFFQNLAFGRDERAVCGDGEAKSIGQEETFEEDIGQPDILREILLRQTETVAARLRRHQLLARRVGLKIRFGDFQTITRSQTLGRPTDQTGELIDATRGIFDRWVKASFAPVRLLGMHVAELTQPPAQMDLFADPQSEKQAKLDAVMDSINAKLGRPSLRRGGAD